MSYDMAFKGTLVFKDKRAATKALASFEDDDCVIKRSDIDQHDKQLRIECFTSAPASMWEPTCAILETIAGAAKTGYCNAQYDSGEGEDTILRLRYHAGGREEEIDGPFDDDMAPMRAAGDGDPTRAADDGDDRGSELLAAAMNDDFARMRKLLAAGAPPRAAIHPASFKPEVLALLLVHGLPARGSGQDSPLCMVARGRSAKCARMLLAAGAQVEEADTPARATPLMLAAEAQQPAIVELLLAHRANPNARDANGTTPLMYAVSYGGEPVPAVVTALVRAGADTELKNAAGETFWELTKQNLGNEAAMREVVATARR